MRNPTERFSTRVENYVKYRPHYPLAVLDLLRQERGLNPQSVVADIGSGTGISTALLLNSGALVYAVEPNADMRHAAENWLGGKPNFRSVVGQAEATTLGDASVDIITAGQAFHWFEPDQTRIEFLRILRPDGWLVLIWNERLGTGSSFQEGYEWLLKEYMPEYMTLNHKEVAREELAGFFLDREMRTAQFDNAQTFDFEGLRGRVLSSSYAPEPGDPLYEPMLAALRDLFEQCQTDGLVEFKYETQVFYGSL